MKIKKIFQALLVFSLGLIFIFLAHKLYFVDGNIDLTKSKHIVGKVTSSYKTTRRTGGRYASDVPIFAFTIDSYHKTLGAYRPNKNYDFLIDNLKIGDTIKVYFRESKLDNINIDVYQIEKNDKIVLDYETYGKNHRNLSYFILLVGLTFFFISYKIFTQKK